MIKLIYFAASAHLRIKFNRSGLDFFSKKMCFTINIISTYKNLDWLAFKKSTCRVTLYLKKNPHQLNKKPSKKEL